jgi:hypothetical protein
MHFCASGGFFNPPLEAAILKVELAKKGEKG